MGSSRYRRRFMLQRLVVLGMGLLFAVHPTSGAKRGFRLEDLYRLRTADNIRLSPDGRLITFTLTTSDLAKAKRTKHIWMMDPDGGNAREFTHGEKGESSPVFS